MFQFVAERIRIAKERRLSWPSASIFLSFVMKRTGRVRRRQAIARFVRSSIPIGEHYEHRDHTDAR